MLNIFLIIIKNYVCFQKWFHYYYKSYENIFTGCSFFKICSIVIVHNNEKGQFINKKMTIIQLPIFGTTLFRIDFVHNYPYFLLGVICH